MANQLLELFGSYDLFGKAVPGAVLLLGILSLLPSTIFELPTISSSEALVNLAVFLAIVLLLGLMIGQAVHTFADNIEKIFRWVGQRVVHTLQYLRVRFPSVTFDLSIIQDDDDSESLSERVIQSWRNNTLEWCRKRFWGTYDSLTSHRRLFAQSIKWNYGENETRWPEGKKGILYDRFCEQYQQIYDQDIRRQVPEDIENIYPLLTSRLSIQGTNEHRKFQSIYSFCRSMWVVCFLLFIGYSYTIYADKLFGVSNYVPEILMLIPESARLLLPLIAGTIMMIFMDASGTYKRHFIEYLIADFANTEDIDGEESTDSKQLRFDDV